MDDKKQSTQKMDHIQGSITIAIHEFRELDSSIAANLIVERLEPRLLAFAKKLTSENRLRNDAADLVNQCLADMFYQLRNDRDGQKISDSDSLWSILATLLRQEAIDEFRRVNAEKRGGPGRYSQHKLTSYLVQRGLLSQDDADDVLRRWETADKTISFETWLIRDGVLEYEELGRALLERPNHHVVKDRQSMANSSSAGDDLSLDQIAAIDINADRVLSTITTVLDQIEDPAMMRLLDLKMVFRDDIEEPALLNLLDPRNANRKKLTNQEIANILFAEKMLETRSRESVRRKFEMLKKLATEKIQNSYLLL